jgi:phosphoglycolate phosphatase
MLILFDIDGTLYHGDGTGRAAFLDAGREIFGERFVEHVFDLSGRLDPWIYSRYMELNGLERNEQIDRTFREACHRNLRRRIESGRHDIRALPGTIELVQRLGARTDITLGLLTGNWEANGRLKVDSVGFDSRQFPICAWGDDGPTRDDLPPVARKRYLELRGVDIASEEVVVIGDTIHDVNCARAHGCRSLAVCTGGGREADLRAAGADVIMADLSDLDAVCDWLVMSTGSSRQT